MKTPLLESTESIFVKSLANGNMLVEITYIHGMPGVLGRMTLAREIADILRQRIGKGKAAAKKER